MGADDLVRQSSGGARAGYDPFAALGVATGSISNSQSGPRPARIRLPWVTGGASGVCLLLGIMALAAQDSEAAPFLLALSFSLGIVAMVTGLFRSIELRLIDIERVLRERSG
jgi:hypothetical protein